MPFYVRIVRNDEPATHRRPVGRAHASSALADGLASFARGMLFGFGMLIVLIVALSIADAAGVSLPQEASQLLQWLYGR